MQLSTQLNCLNWDAWCWCLTGTYFLVLRGSWAAGPGTVKPWHSHWPSAIHRWLSAATGQGQLQFLVHVMEPLIAVWVAYIFLICFAVLERLFFWVPEPQVTLQLGGAKKTNSDNQNHEIWPREGWQVEDPICPSYICSLVLIVTLEKKVLMKRYLLHSK